MVRRIHPRWALPTSLPFWPKAESRQPTAGFTLVEMLVAMAITLVMMAAVVTLFANVSNSVRNRRATIEMSSQLRHVRNVLQQDLQGATCPGLTWQRPESNHGYIELIEGQHREANLNDGTKNFIQTNPSTLTDGVDDSATNPPNMEIDHAISSIPSSNLTPFKDATGTVQQNWATDGGGLGDYDDILALTVRNEHEPFVGRIPADVDASGGFSKWGNETIESPLAEVVWFAMENPSENENPTHFFGEPGMRTIYRRTLLIAPWVNPYGAVDVDGDGLVKSGNFTFKAVPGLVRMLPSTDFGPTNLDLVFAALIAFQDRYDLSVRAEWDENIQHWKIVANTLADLTKRENRFLHYGFVAGAPKFKREFPYPMVSFGAGCPNSTTSMAFVSDPEYQRPIDAKATAHTQNIGPLNGLVTSYTTDPNNPGQYFARPFTYISNTPADPPATANAVLDDDGHVVRVVHGPVPLWGPRRGEDVMMTDVLAFDLRVYDPGAPLFATRKRPYDSQKGLELDVVLSPTDPGWSLAYMSNDNMKSGYGIGYGNANPANVTYPYVGQGAYVDLGYGYDTRNTSSPGMPAPSYYSTYASSAQPWFFTARALSDVYGNQLAPGFCVYDTWSFHYENDGVNEDADTDPNGAPLIDEGTNGLEDVGNYYDPAQNKIIQDTRLGPDDVGERETTPPYDKPLRGMQVVIRTYERDSRAIRQVRVNQHFMPE
jgi:prepilin-type N-terminal cleavage/methylation domain-containing protein